MVAVIGIKVPKNICSNIKKDDRPVAVPESFARVAVITPRPTELSEKIAIKKKAKKSPTRDVCGSKPNGNAKR